MACIRTEACNFKHCTTCSEYEVPRLTITDMTITDNNICQYCQSDNNDFVILNDTKEYSGMEIALNRQGMLRVRYYEGYNQLWSTEDIMNVKFCPICGRKLST